MDKKTHKFRPVENGKIGEPMTPFQMLSCRGSFSNFIQFTGIKDADKEEVYEGSVLELRITDELMDHSKNTFFNSNLGKAMEKDRSIISVICTMDLEKNYLSCGYAIYFVTKDGVIMDEEENEPDKQAFGSDFMFPAYLCEKGARIIGNLAINEDIIENILKYSKWEVQTCQE